MVTTVISGFLQHRKNAYAETLSQKQNRWCRSGQIRVQVEIQTPDRRAGRQRIQGWWLDAVKCTVMRYTRQRRQNQAKGAILSVLIRMHTVADERGSLWLRCPRRQKLSLTSDNVIALDESWRHVFWSHLPLPSSISFLTLLPSISPSIRASWLRSSLKSVASSAKNLATFVE